MAGTHFTSASKSSRVNFRMGALRMTRTCFSFAGDASCIGMQAGMAGTHFPSAMETSCIGLSKATSCCIGFDVGLLIMPGKTS